MTELEIDSCFRHGKNLIDDLAEEGCNIVGFGEMGIGNTSSASLLMSYVCKLPIEECVGRGTGLNDIQLQNKIDLLKKAQARQEKPTSAKKALEVFGGFEIAQICGAMMEAYHQNMIFLVDGFIATSAYLVAQGIASRNCK